MTALSLTSLSLLIIGIFGIGVSLYWLIKLGGFQIKRKRYFAERVRR